MIGCESGAAVLSPRWQLRSPPIARCGGGRFCWPRLVSQRCQHDRGALNIVLGPHSGLPGGIFRDRYRKGRVRVSPDTSSRHSRCGWGRGGGRRARAGAAAGKARMVLGSFAEKEMGNFVLGVPCQLRRGMPRILALWLGGVRMH